MKIITVYEAIRFLRRGEVLLVPTETVMGLVAAETGLQKLSEIKGRDPQKPIALLCSTKEEAFRMASKVPEVAEELAERYWPGPLTLVLNKTGGGTIGVRVPDHEVTRQLLTIYGAPLYATSANLAGEKAPAAIEEVDARIAGAVSAVVEGETGTGEASAVVDASSDGARLLRATEFLTEDKLLLLVGETKENV